ncbi:AMP-binding protein [Alcaligenaceae bacterium]|nr:AMP-binding protein [Alcaligenaceae bacterium]
MGVRPASITFPALLAEQAARYGGREAAVGSRKRLTYAELRAEVLQVARGLAALGVRRGDHVGILMGNRPEWIVSFLAAHQVGAVVVALNTWSSARELEHALSHADVRVLVAQEQARNQSYREMVDQARGRLPLLRHAVWLCDKADGAAERGAYRGGDHAWNDWSRIADRGDENRRVYSTEDVERLGAQVEGADNAFLLYSSGSTSLPKGILLGHRAAIENGWNIGERQHVTQDDRLWLVVSLFWSFGSVNATASLMSHGGCLVLQERFDAHEALALIERERCTVFYGTPNMAFAMQTHAERGRYDLSSLRTGAAIGTPEQLMRIVDLGVTRICNIYGQTETYGNCAVIDADEPLDVRLRSVGPPLPGVAVRIIDLETGKEAPCGQDGEIRVKGYVFNGYYKNEEQTRQAFDEEGFFRTGDLGRRDDEGRLYFRGRINEMVKSGGINVAPAEVEEVLMRHPDVHTAFVVGLPDPVLDQILGAVIIARAGHVPTADELQRYCRGEMAVYKIPARFRFLEDDELPLTTTGKVQKNRLHELFSEAEARLPEPGAAGGR